MFGLVFLLCLSFVSAAGNIWYNEAPFDTTLATQADTRLYGYNFSVNTSETINYISFKINDTLQTADECKVHSGVTGHALLTTVAIIGSGTNKHCNISGTNFTQDVDYYVVVGSSAGNYNVRYLNNGPGFSAYPLVNSVDFIIKRRVRFDGASWIIEANPSITTSFSSIETVYVDVPTDSDFTLINVYNSTNIINFTAQFTNTTNSINITTINGTIKYPADQIINITIFNITGIEGVYFNQTKTDINTSSNLEIETYQSILTVGAIEKITDNVLTTFNVSVSSDLSQFNTSTNNITTFFVNVGEYNVTGKAEDISVNATTIVTSLSLQTVNTNLSFGGNVLNITARDNISNVNLTNFDISVFLNGSFIENLTTTTGYILFTAPNGTYNIFINALNYASTNENITLLNKSQNHTFNLFQSNSVFINIFNQTNGLRIFDSVVISFIQGESQIQNTTTSSSFFVANLTAGNYTISFNSADYTKVSYDISVPIGSNQTLNAYLPHSSLSDEVTFEMLDLSSGAVLEDVSFAISRFIGLSLTQFLVLNSDVTGKVGFNYEQDTEYLFVLSKENYVTKSFVLNPILFDEYTVKMERTTGQENTVSYSEVNIFYDPKQYRNNVNHNITVQFTSPKGVFDTYGFNMTWKNTILSGAGINANGETFTTNLSVSNADFDEFVILTYFYKTTFGDEKVFVVPMSVITFGTNNNTLMGNKNNHYGLGILERTAFATMWAIFLGGAAAQVAGGPGAALAGIFVYAIFGYLGWLEFWVAIIPIIILFIFLAWGKN